MKKLLCVGILILMCGCIGQPKSNSDVARSSASVDSIGTVGPNGEVILFLKKGSFIEVRECSNSTVLGTTAEQALAKCDVVASLKYYKTDFEAALKYALIYGSLNNLDSENQADFSHYQAKGFSIEQYTAYVRRLNEINDFIKAYGGANANLVEKVDLEKKINDNSARMNAISKIDALIFKSVQNIMDQSKLDILSYSSDGNKILYNLLSYILKNPGPFVFKGNNKALGELLYKKLTIDPQILKGCYLSEYSGCDVLRVTTISNNLYFEKTNNSVQCQRYWNSSSIKVGTHDDLLNQIQSFAFSGICNER